MVALVATKEPGYYTLGKGGPGQVSLSDPIATTQTEVVCHTMREEHKYNLDREQDEGRVFLTFTNTGETQNPRGPDTMASTLLAANFRTQIKYLSSKCGSIAELLYR